MAVRCVRALMDRHALPRYRQSAWLADAFGLSYAQAHRKMNGAAPWTLEDLARVAGLLGETLPDLVTLIEQRAATTAQLRSGSASVPCELWIGAPIERTKPGTLVAARTPAGWIVLSSDDAGSDPTFSIDRLLIRPGGAERRVIAVLDDDEDVTDSICAHLQGSGWDARPFYKTAELQSSARTQHYDAFIIDWLVGESSTLKLIAALRADDAASPIVVLTAQVLAGVVQESEIAEAVATYNLVFAEKPVRMAILSASLTRAFAST
ncbi:MAG: helix-turn-helix domain-containing protein [Caldimonas sp.]